MGVCVCVCVCVYSSVIKPAGHENEVKMNCNSGSCTEVKFRCRNGDRDRDRWKFCLFSFRGNERHLLACLCSAGLDGDKKDDFDLDAYPEIVADRLMKKQHKKVIVNSVFCFK